MLINILTRTHNRKNYFTVHKESVDSQTYKKKRHIVWSDVECEYYPEAVRYEQLKSDWLQHNYRAIQHDHTPRNLYINDLLDEVKEWYCLILDDDDIFLSKHSLAMIARHITGKEQMIFWKVKFPYLSIPRRFEKEPIVWDIATCWYVFDIATIRKNKIKMWEYSWSDWLFAYDVYHASKEHKRIDAELTGIQKQDGMHNFWENDLDSN